MYAAWAYYLCWRPIPSMGRSQNCPRGRPLAGTTPSPRSGGRHSHNRVLHILKILIKVVPVANQDSERFPNSQTTVFCPGDDLIPTIWYLPILHAEKQQRANRIYSKNGVTRANSFRYEFQNSATPRSDQKTTFWRCRKNVVRRNVWKKDFLHGSAYVGGCGNTKLY